MTLKPSASEQTELEAAAAGRRSFGNTELAANAEFQVIAEALRELVDEIRLIRVQIDKRLAVAAPQAASGGSPAGARPPTPK